MGQSIPTLVGRVKGSTPLFSTIALLNPDVNRDFQSNIAREVLLNKIGYLANGPEHPDLGREGQGFDSLILHNCFVKSRCKSGFTR